MPWLALVGIGLLLALLAVAFLQSRQYLQLHRAYEPGRDFAMLTLYQSETEYLRLRDQWRAASDERAAFDVQALRDRYDLWVDCVAQLRSNKPQRLLGEQGSYTRTLQQADAFVAAADRAFGVHARVEPTRDFVVALLPALEALDAPLHAITLQTARRLDSLLAERADAVRAQSRIGLGLTTFLCVLTLAFAALSLRQLRQLRERRLALEDLTTHLSEARRVAESASQAKSTFLADMSHEIRTRFHGLMRMLSLLRESGLSPRQIDHLRSATESADHLLDLLNDILDMSQIESGRMTISPVPVAMRALLHEVESLMRPRAIAKHLALHIDADPAVPERVLADPLRVKQVVLNLLSNAIKFSDRGAVVLDLRCGADGQGRLTLEFIVTDNGVGMDEKTIAGLFKRFMQADSPRSRRQGSTGLGLEISRNLARLMAGDITVRSKPGQGSRFSFQLPVQAVSEPGTAAAAATSVPGPSKPLQVLVAEDHPVNRQYMAALLENLGHVAHFTTNGREALEAARTRPFDLVLMDLQMPVLDGIAATLAIRALPDAATSTLPIVALTADAFDETRERCLVAGMNDYLTKPVSPQKLATLLRRLFGSRAAPPPPASEHAPTLAAVRCGGPALLDESAIAMSLQAMPGPRLLAMIEAFLDQGPETVQRLRAAVRDAQPLELRVNAHAARGAALNLGLAGLAATAEALHEGAAHLPAHEIARLVQRFEEQLPLTRQAVSALGLDRLPAVPVTR